MPYCLHTQYTFRPAALTQQIEGIAVDFFAITLSRNYTEREWLLAFPASEEKRVHERHGFVVHHSTSIIMNASLIPFPPSCKSLRTAMTYIVPCRVRS